MTNDALVFVAVDPLAIRGRLADAFARTIPAVMVTGVGPPAILADAIDLDATRAGFVAVPAVGCQPALPLSPAAFAAGHLVIDGLRENLLANLARHGLRHEPVVCTVRISAVARAEPVPLHFAVLVQRDWFVALFTGFSWV